MNVGPDRKLDSISRNYTVERNGKTDVRSVDWRKQAGSSAGNGVTSPALFPAVDTAFQKADLKNPTRVNEIVNSAVSQLLEAEFPGLASSDRQVVGNWMGKDPILRGFILRGYERVLS